MKARYASPVLGIIFAALLAVSTLYNYFTLLVLPWYSVEFAYLAIVAMGAVWVFVSGAQFRFRTCLSVTLMLMLPFLVVLAWSILQWVLNLADVLVIRRGIASLAYLLLDFTMVAAAAVMFGRKAVDYTVWGFLGGNTLILLDTVRRFGPANTLSQMGVFFAGGAAVDNPVSRALEIHDLTFAMAVLFLYYLLYGKGIRYRWFYVSATAFYMLLGWKRSILLAVMIVAIYRLIMFRPVPKLKMHLNVLLGIGLMIASVTYIILIRNGLFAQICQVLGINTMGRIKLYSLMKPYYEISLFFPGLGYGRTTLITMEYMDGMRRLHNDILAMYIDTGMIVFLLWLILTYIVTYRFLIKRYSYHAAEVYMALSLYCYVTYLTGNTLNYFSTQTAWHMAVICAILHEMEQLGKSSGDMSKGKQLAWKGNKP